MDAHLMVEHPETIALQCMDAGATFISFHTETVDARAFRLIDGIRSRGAKVGIVLNPETSPDQARYYLEFADKVTVMTVDPGFSGQRFVRPALKKIEALRELREREGYAYSIEADGSCNARTFRDLAEAGVEVFIVGTSGLFGLDSDIRTAWRMMKDDFDAAVAGIK
jgi:D-allulose-6-phosphate 3-epimerase